MVYLPLILISHLAVVCRFSKSTLKDSKVTFIQKAPVFSYAGTCQFSVAPLISSTIASVVSNRDALKPVIFSSNKEMIVIQAKDYSHFEHISL